MTSHCEHNLIIIDGLVPPIPFFRADSEGDFFFFEGRCRPLVTTPFPFLLSHPLLFWAGVQDPSGWELSGVRVPPAASTLSVLMG